MEITNNKGLYGFETDTVWGLGCFPNDKKSVDNIYEIKGRDRSKPLILMSSDIEHLLVYVLNVPKYASNLINKHFPGALTLIFQKSERCPDSITAGNNTVGIRVPNHKGFAGLCNSLEGRVLATTSLNYSNEPPVKDYEEACEVFSDKVFIVNPKTEILDPQNSLGTASTVVLCTGETPKVLRQGNVYI